MTVKYFNVKNGLTSGPITLDATSGNTTTSNLTVTGESNLGAIANVTITGGNSGYVLSTDGSGNLSFIDPSATQSAAPMPIVIDVGNTLTIAANYQGLFGVPLEIDGTLVVDGVLYDVNAGASSGGNGTPGGSNTQIQFNDAGTFGGDSDFTFNKTTNTLAAPNIVVTGDITPSANITYSLGNNTNRFNNLYLSGNTIVLGTASISANGTSIIMTNPDGGQTIMSGSNNTTLGNISSINIDGNLSNVLYGNGVFASAGGTIGATGPIGATGIHGATGATGAAGTNGTNGSTGATGAVGATGSDGATGLTGATGAQGIQGIQGATGVTGATGLEGATGPIGASGATGPQGDKYSTTSTTSLSIGTGSKTLTVATGLAYTFEQDIVIANAIGQTMNGPITSYNSANGELIVNVIGSVGSGTYTSWTVNLDGAVGAPGATGATGPTGATGAAGTNGTNGTDGSTGATGLTGATGAQGIQGIQGATGVTGATGAAGTNGTDGSTGATGAVGATGFTGATGPVAGSNTQVVFNDEGAANGNASLTFNKTTGTLSATLLTGTLTTAAQSNITSVGTLSTLTVSGNANVGNIGGSAGVFTTVAGSLTTSAQSNITSVGTLTSLTVSGNANIDSGTLFVDSVNDRVGLGNTAPSFRLQLGNNTGTSTTTPETISMGGTYSSSAGTNAKMRLWTDGSNVMGLGISANQLDYICNQSTYNHVFYVGGNENFRVASGNSTVTGNLTVKNAGVTALIHSNNDSAATLEVCGDTSTGAQQVNATVYVGQSRIYGGGIKYNSSPDTVTLFRRDNNTDTNFMTVTYNSSDVTFAAGVTAVTLTETSSITLKENFRPIENPLEKVLQLVGKIYDRKDGSNKNEVGLVSEDVEKIIPELVKNDTVAYTRLTVYLLESIKILKDEIDSLKGNKRKTKK